MLFVCLASLASAKMYDLDPPISWANATNLDPDFSRKFEGILQHSFDKAANKLHELRPANYTVFYKQPNGNMELTVVAVFGAMNVRGVNFLELAEDVEVYRTKKRNIYMDFFLKAQPLKFDAHVTVSSMGMATQFQAFGKISCTHFYGWIYHQYSAKPSIMIEDSFLHEPVMDLDAFVPNWLNRNTLITESKKELLPFVNKLISEEFSKHVLLNLNLDAVEDTLNKFRNKM